MSIETDKQPSTSSTIPGKLQKIFFKYKFEIYVIIYSKFNKKSLLQSNYIHETFLIPLISIFNIKYFIILIKRKEKVLFSSISNPILSKNVHIILLVAAFLHSPLKKIFLKLYFRNILVYHNLNTSLL